MTWTRDVKLVNEALLVWDMSTSFGLETPGLIDEYDVSSHEIAEFMSKEEAAKCRRTAAKLNYLSLDNPMIAFASKEASRSMSSPKQGEEIKLKRILRFLRKRPTTTYRYEWQDHPGELAGYTDSDWAGCTLTRRFTSGRSSCTVRIFYSTIHGLKLVCLSSAEAELNAALKMGCEILGMSQFCSEFGYTMKTTINGDSSAVKGILACRGCGKVKHLEVKQLYLQEQVRSGKVEFQKISRKNNPSDA